MSYDINVLVNGNRCKQYNHKGHTYIEAKEGSEYVVEIKNNSWEKVLAVLSVDGLNVLDGKTAEPEGAGYVLPSYTAQRFYGFQYSKDNVATFKFGALGALKIDPATGKPEIDPDTGKTIPMGYAASKDDGSEKNVGVVGVRIWDEVVKPTPPDPIPQWIPGPVVTYTTTTNVQTWQLTGVTSSLHGTASYSIGANYLGTGSCYAVSSSWGGSSLSASYSCNASSNNPTVGWYSSAGTTVMQRSDMVNQNSRVYPTNSGGSPYQSLFGGCAGTPVNSNSQLLKEAIADAKAVRCTALANAKMAMDEVQADQFNVGFSIVSPGVPLRETDNSFMDALDATVPKFDMETQWGASRSYKVKEILFERKSIIHGFEIYYASRESLIAMGVDLGTEKKVSFPESFKETQYAQPPKGWKP